MTISQDLNDYQFRTSLQVRLSETDAVGVVYFGSFCQYMDLGRMDYLSSLRLDLSYGAVPGLPPGMVVHSSINFRSPAAYRDYLDINVRVAELGTTSYTFHFLIRDQRQPRVVATGEMTLVWFDEELRPHPLPDSFRSAVASFEGLAL